MQEAGKAARFFHIDPADVLDRGMFKYAVTIAAYRYVSEVEAAEAKRQAAEQKAQGSKR